MSTHQNGELNFDNYSDSGSLSSGDREMGSSVIRNLTDFQDEEIIRIEIYEEVPDVQRQTVVREKVQVKKVISQAAIEPQA